VSAVGEVLDKLSGGQMTTGEATAAMNEVTWPDRPPTGRTLEDIESDPDPMAMEPGDFGEVESAYVEGRITLEQYEALATAAMGT
jgi:hypothetical protein